MGTDAEETAAMMHLMVLNGWARSKVNKAKPREDSVI